jgi:hypothetical protein
MADVPTPTIRALRMALDRAQEDLARLCRWRERGHEYDDDIGAPPRDFRDTEEWDAMESLAAQAYQRVVDAKAVDDWNEAHPIGTPVTYWSGARQGAGVPSSTRSEAQLDSAHQAVVWVEGHRSCIALSHVESPTRMLEIVDAPGDACNGTKKLPDGTPCLGCRSCA